MNLEKQTKWTEIHQSQPTDMTFSPSWSELPFPETSALMTDGSEKLKPLIEVRNSELACYWKPQKVVSYLVKKHSSTICILLENAWIFLMNKMGLGHTNIFK